VNACRHHPILLALALVATPIAHAVEVRCVDTNAELNAAALVAESDAVEIHLVQGTYNIDNTVLRHFDGIEADPDDDITIVGGYNAGCGSRVLEPFSTVLTSSSGDWWINIGGGDNSGNVRFESLTLEDLPMAVRLGGPFSSGYSAKLSRVALVRSPVRLQASTVVVSQTLAIDAPDVPQFRGCAIVADDMDSISVLHSVFTGNANRGFCTENVEPAGGWTLSAINNIFWDNGGPDIYTRTSDDESDVILLNNIIESTSIVPASIHAPAGSLNQNPLFVAASSNNLRVQPGSPAVNSGTPLPLGITQDIDGGPRQVGTAPDRGAYETNVDDTQIITVTTAADQIAPLITGSLRWAIIHANGDPGLNYIRFAIPGSCPRIIHLAAPLPPITDRVIVEGYTQPGSEPNASIFGFYPTICIGVVGDLSDDYAFRIPSSVGASHYLQLSGVAIGGFDVAAVDLQGGAGSWVHGVQFGGVLGSSAIANNAVNVRMSGTTYYNLVGGEERADRNLIPFAYTAGVQILSSNTNGSYVRNNLIGTTASGAAAAPNQIGVYIASPGNDIRDNTISGNQSYGIQLIGVAANDNHISNNRIGLEVPSVQVCFPPPCEPPALPNIQSGIIVRNDASDNTFIGNIIAYNGAAGMRILDGQHNSLLSNLIYDNESLGIDLNGAGADSVDNDAAPGAATMANRGLNYPALSLAEGTERHGNVRSIFASTNGTYILQVFSDSTCDASGHGEGRVYHASALVTIDNAPSGSNGSVVSDIPVSWGSRSLEGRQFSLVARDVAGNTSEFSVCAPYQCDQIFGYGTDAGGAEICSPP
jgi:hypothetical protein